MITFTQIHQVTILKETESLTGEGAAAFHANSHGSTNNSDHDREGLTLRLKVSLPVEGAFAMLPFGGSIVKNP